MSRLSSKNRRLTLLLSLLLWAMPSVAQDITSNLVLHYQCNETSGTTAADRAGTAQNGTLFGNATFGTGHPGTGNGCVFDGTGDYVNTPDHADLDIGTGDLTVAFWMLATNATVQQYLVQKGGPGGGAGFPGWAVSWSAHQAGDPLVLQLNDSSGNAAGSWNVGDITNVWHHVCAVFDRDVGFLLYLDGTQQGTTNTTITSRPASADNANAVWAGAYFSGPSFYFFGTLDDLRLWKRALTEADCDAHMAYTEEGRRRAVVY